VQSSNFPERAKKCKEKIGENTIAQNPVALCRIGWWLANKQSGLASATQTHLSKRNKKKM
jgi:hypothetical protein